MWEDIKAWFKWLYDWVTVLVATSVGSLAGLLELLSILSSVDLTPILPASVALQIITGIAIAKGLLSWWLSKKEPADA